MQNYTISLCDSAATPTCPFRLEHIAPNVADSALLGTVLLNREIAFLESYRIILRRDHRSEIFETRVKILSGCPSGHDPAFTSYIGHGMLTGVVLGDVFQPPNHKVIFRAIEELGKNHRPGVLVIINNSPGIRLAFGTAIERAHKQKIRVKLLVVEDDCFGPANRALGKRGLCGIIFLFKIAGAMAEHEHLLSEIHEYCKPIADGGLFSCIATINSKTCFCPNEPIASNLMIELGAGFYGESGVFKAPINGFKLLVNLMLENLFNSDSEHALHNDDGESTTLAVMINNLGTTSPTEMKIFAAETIQQLKERGFIVERTYCGSFFSVINLKGFIISLLKITENCEHLQEYLNEVTSVPGWQHSCPIDLSYGDEELEIRMLSSIDTDEGEELHGDGEEEKCVKKICFGPKISTVMARAFPALLTFACDAISSCEKQLNLFDTEYGDGDAGSNFKRGAHAVRIAVAQEEMDFFRPGNILYIIASILTTNMPGTLGVLYSVALEMAAEVFMEMNENETITIETWVDAIRAAAKAIQTHGNVECGDRTMLDALVAISTILISLRDQDVTYLEALEHATQAAENAATISQILPRPVTVKPVFFDYLHDESPPSHKYPDPSIQGVSIWMRAIFEGMKIKCPT